MLVWSVEKSIRCCSRPNVLAGVTTGVFSVLLTNRGEGEDCKVVLGEAPGTSGRVARSSHPPHGGRAAIETVTNPSMLSLKRGSTLLASCQLVL